MKKLLLILEGTIHPDESAWAEGVPGLAPFLERGTAYRLEPAPAEDPVPEAGYLGIASGRIVMAEGPLVVAAFGADPPERTLHYRVDLIDAQGNLLPKDDPDLPLLHALAQRLDTARLTHVEGEGATLGLVQTGWADVGTEPPGGALPDGEFDRELRRLIDDSHNLALEFPDRAKRRDEGRPEVGGFWPWGQGARHPVPNLAIARREPARVETTSLRLRGLARLAGYAGRGKTRSRIVVKDLSHTSDPEERVYLLREALSKLDPKDQGRFTLLAPGKEGGLALFWDEDMRAGLDGPFDERRVVDRAGPVFGVAQAAARALG